jgi:antirestriction protein
MDTAMELKMDTVTEQKTKTAIYVACLAAYNSGFLHGTWINVDLGEEGILQKIEKMLERSPIINAEEWAIHDYEGFGTFRISQYEDIATVCKLDSFRKEYGDIAMELMGDLGMNLINSFHCKTMDEQIEAVKSYLEDHYKGEYEAEVSFVEQFIDDIYQIPEGLHFYIDYDLLKRDLFSQDYFSVKINDDFHIFSRY